jgi:D-amino-acid oxidase
MQRDSFGFYWSLAGSHPESGVQVLPMREYFDDRDDDDGAWYRDLVPDYCVIPRRGLPEGCTFGVKYTALAMNPQILLPWLRNQLLKKGVKFVKMELQSIEQAKLLLGDVKIVVNASGLGAKALAGDEKVKPVRGQTMFIKTSFNELVMKEGSEYTYVIPRAGSGGVIIGGVKSDRLDAEVDVDLKSDILARVNRVTGGAFADVDLKKVTDIVGFRPGRDGGLRVEREKDVVHAYGASGAGYIFSFGVAERVKQIIGEGILRGKL